MSDFIDISKGTSKQTEVVLRKKMEQKEAEYRAQLKPFCYKALKDYVQNKIRNVSVALKKRNISGINSEIKKKVIPIVNRIFDFIFGAS